MPAQSYFERQAVEDEDEPTWDDDAFDEADVERRSSRLTSPLYVLPTMAALGVFFALGWHYSGAKAWFDESKPVVQVAATPVAATPAAPAVVASAVPATESELARAMAEIETLKKSIAELRSTNQQMATTISALQTAQEDLRQQVSAARAAPPVPVHAAATKPAKPVKPAKPKAATTGSVPVRAADAYTAARPARQNPISLTAPRP